MDLKETAKKIAAAPKELASAQRRKLEPEPAPEPPPIEPGAAFGWGEPDAAKLPNEQAQRIEGARAYARMLTERDANRQPQFSDPRRLGSGVAWWAE